MSDHALLAVVTATRWWLCVYTTRLDPAVAAARRTEIECDLWEMLHDADPQLARRRTGMALRRLLSGMIDDVAWRMDHAPMREQLLTRRAIALAAATLIIASLWSLPPLVFKGRREVVSCAETAKAPTTTAALRHDVIRCAGAFFHAQR